MKYTHLIWDFNGTVLNDVSVSLASTNAMLVRCGLEPLASEEAYRAVFRFPIQSYYASIGFDFDKTPYEVLAPEWVAEYMARASLAPLNDGVAETIDEVRRRGISQILISATEEAMLRIQLRMLGLEDRFDGVFGLDNIHAVSKRERVRQWFAAQTDVRVLFFGDTDHDAEVARAIGQDCILFSGGHQSKDYLATLGCPVVERISDVSYYL